MKAKGKLKRIQEFSGPSGVHVEGRILKNALLLGKKSVNRNRIYGESVRKTAAPLFVGKSVFFDHTKEEDGQKYYRRPYTELLGIVEDAWNGEDGIRGNIILGHHPAADNVIKNVNDKLPIGGFSPEMDGYCFENDEGIEECSMIPKVRCIALCAEPATAKLIESIVDEDTTSEELDEDGKYHKRRHLMTTIESILMEIEDEEESSDQQKFLRIHQILGEHLGIFKEDCPMSESVQESVAEVKTPLTAEEKITKKQKKVEKLQKKLKHLQESLHPETIQEGVEPEVKTALPPDLVAPTGKRLSREELFRQIWS